jgi:hypothetical protein
MKIQCSCGAKYAFDITPEMAQAPIRFVCQNCGLDSSEFVNELIRRELAAVAPAGEPLSPDTAPTPGEAQPAGTGRIRIQAARHAAPAPADSSTLQFCAKHPGQRITNACVVCQKPICPKCMELFGYVCSPRCRANAEAQGIEIPVYGGKGTVKEARQWRKVGLVAKAIAAVTAGLLGFWFWYAWFGSVPKTVFSVRFAEPAYSGQSVLCGRDQIVFLHGGTLARHDMKANKELWSRQILDRKLLADEAARILKQLQANRDRIAGGNPDAVEFFKIPSAAELTEIVERAEAAALQLHIHGQRIWVTSAHDVVRYDWESGKPLQTIQLAPDSTGMISRGDELLLMEAGGSGQQVITHISLATGEARVEKIGEPTRQAAAGGAQEFSRGAGMASSRGREMAGLPTGAPGSDAGKPLDPARVAEQAQNLPFPARIALPATLSSELHQERILAETKDGNEGRAKTLPGSDAEPADRFSVIPGEHDYVQFSIRMLEERFVTRNAMKAPPAKSVLDGNLTASQSAEAANEILNDMQRARGGETVTEDESRYRVTVRRPPLGEVPDWTGEVIGPPSLFPLKTVSVVAAGKTLVVLDRNNKKLWQNTLSYTVAGGGGTLHGEAAPLGEGPCVERGDTLYVFDEAVLTAFDLTTGTVRWRLPSVGTVGLFFDDQGMMYVNTTTASPERIKYSRQIDVSQVTSAAVFKIDPRTGKILWSTAAGGSLAYVSGKFMYTFSAYQADERDANSPYRTGLETPSHVMIRRLNPANGRVMWEHYERRAPLDVRFEDNSIRLVFKKEVEVLRFVAL